LQHYYFGIIQMLPLPHVVDASLVWPSAGKAARDKRDYETAAQMYTDALKCHGSSCQNDSCSDKTLHSQLLVDRGSVYYQQDCLMHALADCNRALQLIPNCSKALNLRSNVAEKYNDTARVLQVSSQLLQCCSCACILYHPF